LSAVSNSSTLINLGRIGMLWVLRDLFGEILVPDAVYHEVVEEGAGLPGAAEVGQESWIKRQSVANRPLVTVVRRDLGPGEAEAIALAVEAGARVLLMDERTGREAAPHLGVSCAGLVGVLAEAKRRGLVVAVKPHLDALRDVAGFWLSGDLYEKVLRDLGEA
jgi:predicted nucleic acid-binding protein